MMHRAATGQAAHTGGTRSEDGRGLPEGKTEGRRHQEPRTRLPGPDLPNPPSPLSVRRCAPAFSEHRFVS
jgi:hypothetical protein